MQRPRNLYSINKEEVVQTFAFVASNLDALAHAKPQECKGTDAFAAPRHVNGVPAGNKIVISFNKAHLDYKRLE